MSAPSTDPESLQRCIGTGRRRRAHCSRAFDRAVGCGRFSLQVIVENRGDGIIPAKLCRRRRRTGYSVLYVSASFWIGSLLRNTPYDPVKDFSPVSLVAISPDILVVHPALPVSTVKELIALARARPGELNHASGNRGAASNHITSQRDYSRPWRCSL